jgi:hypothetical protein
MHDKIKKEIPHPAKTAGIRDDILTAAPFVSEKEPGRFVTDSAPCHLRLLLSEIAFHLHYEKQNRREQAG